VLHLGRVADSIAGKGKRYGVDIARKMKGCSPRIVSTLEFGSGEVVSGADCSSSSSSSSSFLAILAMADMGLARDASAYHARSTGRDFRPPWGFGPGIGKVWVKSEEIGEAGELGQVRNVGEFGEVGEVGEIGETGRSSFSSFPALSPGEV